MSSWRALALEKRGVRVAGSSYKVVLRVARGREIRAGRGAPVFRAGRDGSGNWASVDRVCAQR
jgi:hypothetical protein